MRIAYLVLILAALTAAGLYFTLPAHIGMLHPVDLRARISLPKPPKAVSMRYMQLSQAPEHRAGGFGICMPPTGPVSFLVEATATEYVHFERNPAVSFVITETGGVENVTLRTTSGSPELDAKALAVVAAARYQRDSKCMRWAVETAVSIDF